MCKSITTIGLLVGCLTMSHISYAVDSQHKSKTKSHQQKRLKTIPDTVEEDAWYGNLETNIYDDRSFENITLGYSANNGWDISLSLVNMQMLGANKQFQGTTFLNIGKTFAVTEDYSIIASSQNGVSLVNTQPQLWYSFSSLDNRYHLMPELAVHGGVYLANSALTGTVRQVGFIAGTEITLVENALALQMDYVSGHHSLSGGFVNMLFNLSPKFQVYLGVYIPEQDSGNDFSGTLGFNFSSKNL